MKKDFESILDECLARIRAGEADIESCLSKYPDQANQLRPLLETALLLHEEPQPQPRPEVALQGERLLQARLAEKRLSKAAERGLAGNAVAARTASRSALPVRWRFVVALAGYVAAIAIGAGLVSASNYSMPGDFLYPVKIRTEQIRLVLTPSEVGKIDLYIALAERRMQEITEMSKRSETDQVASLVPLVSQHLQEAGQVVTAVGEEKAGQELSAKLEESAVRQLGDLEEALQSADEETKPVIEEALKASAESYGTAVEDAIASAPPPAVVGAMGTIQVVVTDPPAPEAIDSLVVQVAKIEAHLAAGSNSRWVTLVEEPQSFDLIELAEGVQKNLGSQAVDAGTYTQIRVTITRATVTVDGAEYDVSVPSGTLKFVRPFKVEADETKAIILDFDGKRSIDVNGTGEYVLKPTANLLVPEERENDSHEDRRVPGGDSHKGSN